MNPTTPNRFTRVRFDTPDQVLTSSVWGSVISFDKASQVTRSTGNQCTLIPNIGWTLTPQQTDMWAVHELTSSQAQILTPAGASVGTNTLSVAPGTQSKNGWRFPTELVGPAPTSGDVATSSDFVLYRTAPNGTLLSAQSLTSDLTAFPDITSIDLNYNQPLVRVAVDSVMQDGTKPMMFRFTTPSSLIGSPDILYIWYFSGPASLPELNVGGLTKIGQGIYGMVIRGDGQYVLYEKFSVTGVDEPDPVWTRVHQGNYQSIGQVTNTVHRILVFPYTPKTSIRSGSAGGIAIMHTSGDSAGVNTQSLVKYAKGTSDAGIDMYEAKYKGKQGTAPPSTIPAQVRLSQRQDLRNEFQLSMVSYATSGFVIIDPFIIPAILNPSQTVDIEIFGNFPSGTSVNIQLFDAITNAQGDWNNIANPGITPSSVNSITGGFNFSFSLYVANNITSNSYYTRIVLGGTTAVAPQMTQLRFICDGVINTYYSNEFDIQYPASVTEVNISGPSSDPSHETASVNIADLGAQYSILNIRGEFPVKIDTQYSGLDWTDPSNNGAQSVIFDGYSIQEPSHRMGTDMPQGLGNSNLAQFPASNWNTFKGSMLGKWKRLSEVVAPFNWDFSVDPNAPNINTPPYAVDVIAELLGWAGMPDSMIDIGPGSTSSSTQYPIRLFPKGQDEGIVLTAGANIADFIRGIARDYLGSAIIWDANATAGTWSGIWSDVQGCWRLIKPAPLGGPYNILTNFVTSGPLGESAGIYSVNNIEAYPSTMGVGSFSDQIIPTIPIFHDTLDTYVNPPEVNRVVVTGTGELNNGYQKVADQLTCFAINADSYNVNGIYSGGQLTALASGADWIGRERSEFYVDTIGINTPEAAQWVLRRIFDLTAHAIRFVNFVAPLVLVTDSTDTQQTRPRQLRFYDVVNIDNLSYFIRNVSPYWESDLHQLARYELQSIPPTSAPVVPFK